MKPLVFYDFLVVKAEDLVESVAREDDFIASLLCCLQMIKVDCCSFALFTSSDAAATCGVVSGATSTRCFI